MRVRKFDSFIIIFLFCIAPFIQSATDADKAARLSINLLPPVISSFTGNMRWGIFILLILIFLYKIREYVKKVEPTYLLISAFYFVQLIYAFGSQTDLFRYSGLVILSIVLPSFTSLSFSKDSVFLIKYFKIIVYALIAGSIILNIQMIFNGFRFQGFANNPNLYGITAIFWLVVLLLPQSEGKRKNFSLNNIFIGILLITIFLSGSRNALVGVLIVLIFHYKSNLKLIIFPLIIVGVLGYYFSNSVNLNFITDRILNIQNAIQDTDRIITWERAMLHINQNLLWGNDMNAPLRVVGTGNIHNCYLRYLLTMGLIFTALSFIFYIRYLTKILSKEYKNVPLGLVAFIVAYTFMNVGEDFFVGIGSSVIIYFFMTVGLISFYKSDNIVSYNYEIRN